MTNEQRQRIREIRKQALREGVSLAEVNESVEASEQSRLLELAIDHISKAADILEKVIDKP